jgi:hypothetical protein
MKIHPLVACSKANFPKNGAVSMGRCNTGLEFTSGSFKA